MTTMSEDASNWQRQPELPMCPNIVSLYWQLDQLFVLYAFMQKYFEKGVMIGSLKG